MNKGIWYAVGAYGLWGLFPLYWKLLHHIPAIQLIGHRIVWSFVSLVVILVIINQFRKFKNSAISFSLIRIYSLAAILVGINWLTYVWAVNTDHVVETSLGYFINPLISVLIGVIFFREKLRLWQWIPIGIAAIGVLYLTFAFGALPWIALTLAFSFAFYGMVKKIAPLSSLHGLTLETVILFIPAALYLVYCEKAGEGALFHQGAGIDLLLIGAGLVTTIPLLMFAAAAKRIPLSIIGVLQYIAPTIQFLIGILVYHEAFTIKQFVGYCFVWVALLIFATDSFYAYRKVRVLSTK
ncbi:MAG TPA: EamA family transporter RarD [Bacteroidales bacterium]|nr:EamA family transporter RarD [Bacteroidales bacterium]